VEEAFVLQLAEETLVAVVDILVLELLYRVNCDVLIELRQFEDTIELALDPTGRPLRVLFGEIVRGTFGGLYPGDLFS
jgi:hypothetical protein